MMDRKEGQAAGSRRQAARSGDRPQQISSASLRVCYFGTYRAGYVRNQILIDGLRANGVTVYECHALLWQGVEDRVQQASGGWRSPRFWWRVARAYIQLLRAYRRVPDYDVMLIGYPGQFDAYLGRLLTWLRRRPLVLDILMSLHLVAEERGLTRQSPFTGRLIFLLEKGGLKLPDRLIADTAEYEQYYVEKYNLSPAKFRRVPLGVDDRIYRPRPDLRPPDGCFHVVYYGSFLPSHGLETVVGAAAELRHEPGILFHFYGDGPERPPAETTARELGLQNICFHGWIDKEALPGVVAQSHLCLGVFGTTKQARCTIQNKIWEAMLMRRPIVSGDSETVRAELTDREHLYLVPRANAAALAQAIVALKADPTLRERLAAAGYERAQQNTTRAIGAVMKAALSLDGERRFVA